MNGKEISNRQLMAWTALSCTAPILQWAGKDPWLTVLCVATGISALCIGLICWTEGYSGGKALCIIQLLWIVPTLGTFARASASAWPGANVGTMIPVILMALAVTSVWKGKDAAARCSSVLCWIGGGLLGILVLAGSRQIDPAWLSPEIRTPEKELLLIAILPAIIISFQERGKGSRWIPVVTSGILLLISVLTIGTLSFDISSRENWPLYEATRGFRFLGVAQRLEALLSMIISICYFSLFSLLLTVAGEKGNVIRQGCGKTVVLMTAGLSILFAVNPGGFWEQYGAFTGLIVWVVIPAMDCSKKMWKKFEKSENKA